MKLNKKYIMFLLISILSIMNLVGCNKNSAQENNSDMEKVIVHGDYEYYETIDEITNESDIMIYGKVINVDDPIELNVNSENEELDVYTVSSLEVVEVIKGDVSVGDKIKVKQYGGVYNNVNYILENVEYLQPSQEGVFFLQTYEPLTNEEMPYSLLNPEQGYFTFVDDKIEIKNDFKEEKSLKSSAKGSESEEDINKPRTDLFGQLESKEEILKLMNNSIN